MNVNLRIKDAEDGTASLKTRAPNLYFSNQPSQRLAHGETRVFSRKPQQPFPHHACNLSTESHRAERVGQENAPI